MKAFAGMSLLASLLIVVSACGQDSGTPGRRFAAPEVQEKFDQAMVYSGQGRTVDSIALYSEAIELDPLFVNAYFDRAVDHYAMTRYEQARLDYDRVIELDPSIAKAFLNRGRCYQKLGQHEKAIADFDQAFSLEPFKAVYSLKTRSYVMMGKQDDAGRELELGVTAGYTRHYMEWVIESANKALRLGY